MYQVDLTIIVEKITAKKKKLCNTLDVGEKVLVLAERIKKKTALGKFYKETVQNILFTIRKSKV